MSETEALEGTVPTLLIPESFALLMAALAPCFTVPTYDTFRDLVAGWLHCRGRHTVTAVALAAGVVGWRHVSVFHRFFSRARGEPDALGRIVFRLALAWSPADQPLVALVDDTLARKGGKAIALGSMHHDPLLSTVRKAFCSFGHVWVVLALWVPLPVGPRGGPKGVAIPVLFRLYVGRQRGNRADAPSRATSGRRFQAAQAAFPQQRPTKPELARAGIAVVARWAAELAPGRTVYVVGDTAYTNRTTLEGRPANVEFVGRLRLDAALWTPPPPQRPGQNGRPRKRGTRLPTPQVLAASRTGRGTWHRLQLTLYGRRVSPRVFSGTALWYSSLRAAPLRYVVVRDPRGHRKDEAFFCTDRRVRAAFILATYAKRWTLEVTFFDLKQSLGFADPQNQTARAVQRTAPFAGLVYALVMLWASRRIQQGASLGWLHRPWYRRKAAPSFPDLLQTLRHAGTAPPPQVLAPPCPSRCRRKVRAPRRATASASP
jgi:hypothetical protein